MNFIFREDKAYDIVVKNTNELADRIEKVIPIKDQLFTPRMEGANEEIRELSYTNAKNCMVMTYRKLSLIVSKRIR